LNRCGAATQRVGKQAISELAGKRVGERLKPEIALQFRFTALSRSVPETAEEWKGALQDYSEAIRLGYKPNK